MSYLTYIRMFGYMATLLMHVINIAVMASPMHDKSLIKSIIEQDPRAELFAKNQNKFFTCWNVFVQIMFAVVGLICDYLYLKNKNTKNYRLPKYLKGFRDTLFAAILVPMTGIVASFFWTLFLYDRSLVFPVFIDRILSTTSNHILHTMIVPVALWEIIFQPRSIPKSHKHNLSHLLVYLAIYFAMMSYTYYESGFWLYPIFQKAYGTIYFVPLVLLIPALGLSFYYLQWVITYIVWGNNIRLNNQRKTVKKIR